VTPGRQSLISVYNRLYERYGTQHWWPADSPFEVMVGAVLTQNTAWINVERAINNLRQADLLSADAIAAIKPQVLAEYLRPAGYFNVKAKRLQALCEYLVAHPELAEIDTQSLRQRLLAVHGIGPETADDILLYAYRRPVFVIDAYTRRLFGRLGLMEGDAAYETLRANFEIGLGEDVALFNEYHALIVMHAKHVCRKKPLCENCCLSRRCKRRI
jgi:endonuclease III related protein